MLKKENNQRNKAKTFLSLRLMSNEHLQHLNDKKSQSNKLFSESLSLLFKMILKSSTTSLEFYN